MIKNNERIFQLNSRLSKLRDSLCFQLAVNKVDDISLSLLEEFFTQICRILVWEKNGEVDNQELVQLYKSWLQSKCVFNLFTCRQVEIYPKDELIVHQSHQEIPGASEALNLLNDRGIPYMLVTNNISKSEQTNADELNKLFTKLRKSIEPHQIILNITPLKKYIEWEKKSCQS